MTDNNEISEKTARRLKELRESKRLSHIGLCEELSRLYGIKISKSSLINYEATDFSSKSGSNAGMKIEYLRCFADFYGVSADYILGLSDKRTPDVNLQAACVYTGLSETAVEILKSLYDKRDIRAYSDLLSLIICDPDLEWFLGVLEGYFAEEKAIDTSLALSRVVVNNKDLAITAAMNGLRGILDRVSVQFKGHYLTTDERLDIYTEKKMAKREAAKNGKY